VDLERSAEQEELVAAVRAVCRRYFSPAELVGQAGGPVAVVGDGWRALCDLGVFGLRLPPGRGGLGLGLVDAVLVFEELGRHLVPGPLVATEVALAAGLVDTEATSAGPSPVPLVGCCPTGDPHRLVAHLPELDGLLVVDDDQQTVGVVDRPELSSASATAVDRSLDPLTPLWQLPRLPPGRVLAYPYDRWLVEHRLLTAALAVGVAAGAAELAVAYAGQRRQFGRPIGAFQAIKHLCVDLFVAVELARSAVLVAALSADQPEVGSPLRAASAAALVAADAAVGNARGCLQVHGGMGFTWDVPVHLYLNRAMALRIGLGSRRGLAATVARAW
jgi:alkylation response protein AidB-like acyl-CoA dehydrogenase